VRDRSEALADIYDAIGDAERWRRLNERLAASVNLPVEIEQHLQIARQAHEQHVKVARDLDVLAGVHSQLPIGMLVVDRDARVLFANDAARRLLAGQAPLTLVEDCLTGADPGEHSALRIAIERASAAAGRPASTSRHVSFVPLRRPGRRPLATMVFRAGDTTLHVFDDRTPVMLLLLDPDMVPAPGVQILRELFALTAREAELTSLLMQGQSLAEAARAMGITVNTARTFLSCVTAKTDSHSQAGLMERLLAVPRII
jgi:DNA-binding CsgD family transcriptional regulator